MKRIDIGLLSLGILGLFQLATPAGASAAPAKAKEEEDPVLAMCKRDARNILDGMARDKAKNPADAYLGSNGRVSQYAETCIHGPKAAAIKSKSGYSEITTAYGRITTELAALKQTHDAAQKAELERGKEAQAKAEREKAEQAKRDEAAVAAQQKARETERAAEQAKRFAAERAARETKARGLCTQAGQLSSPCLTFLTTIEPDSSKELPNKSQLGSCFAKATTESPDVYAAERLIVAGDTSAYAVECHRMMDVALGADWRKPIMERIQRAAFGEELQSALRGGFQSKCGASAYLEDKMGRTVVLEKATKSQATFLTKKTSDGEVVTVFCSGKVVGKRTNGTTSTALPITEGQIACARARAAIVCAGGESDYNRGVDSCVRPAESACQMRRF